MKTVTEVRESFWQNHPQFAFDFKKRQRQNKYGADIRTAFVDWVDQLHRNGEITDKLANRVTL